MKSKKIFVFLMLPLLLTSCLINIKETRLTYNLDFNLDSEKATILLKGGYLSSSLNIKIEEDIIPGDQLIIKHTGDLLIQESYPSKIDIYNGNVVSYKLIKTTVEEVNLELIDEINFPLFVIIDKEYHFIPYKDYKGNILYGSIMISEFVCHINSLCTPEQLSYSALYSFKIR
ncbi:MAG: hypothetical protein SOV25_01020 [Candidatus Onthovivens sp.]|nr:hypothetical protein [Candidatus Onthovivens sp.]